MKTGQVENEWQVSKRIKRIRWGPSGILVVTNESTLYNAEGKTLLNYRIDGDLVAISPDGRYIATDGDHHIEIRDAASGAMVARSSRGVKFRNLAFAPDGKSLVTISNDDFYVGFWRFDPGGAYTFMEPEGNADRIWFSEDSLKLVAAGGQGAAALRLPANGSYSEPVMLENTLGANFRSQTPQFREVPDGKGNRKVMAKATDDSGRGTVIFAGPITRAGPRQLDMVNAQTLEPITTIYHTGVTLAAVQADGRRAATMDGNGSIRVWDTVNSREIARLAADSRSLMLALSDNGRWLAALTGNGKIELWAIAADDLIAQACHWLEKPCP